MFTACIARKMLTIGVVIAFFERQVLAGVRSFKVSLVYTHTTAPSARSAFCALMEYFFMATLFEGKPSQ